MLKIPFDSLTLAAVVAEARAYVGGKVQKIWQPDESSIVLALYANGKEALFMISSHAVFARAHFVTKRPTSMQPMPGLCTALRSRVDGARIKSIRQINFDRILEMAFETKDGEQTLVAELMGKHSNIMLLDPANRVIAAAKWVGQSKSSRPIQANRKYVAPPFPPKPPLTAAKPGSDLDGYQGVSPFLKKLLSEMGPDGLSAIQTAVKTSNFDPVLVQGSGAYPLSVECVGVKQLSRASISIALEQHYDWAVRFAEIQSLRESLLGQLRRVLLSREVALHELGQAAETAKRAGQFQLMGELILAYGRALPEGATSLEAEDYEARPLSVPLNPELTYLENAETYFGKAKHAKAREGVVLDQIARMSADHAAISSLIERVEAEERLDRLQDLREEAKKRRWLHDTVISTKRKEERPYEGHRIRELLGPGGFTILHGENAESNDYLLVRVAKSNDYWLHVRGSASAHAVIVTKNHPEKVSREVLMFAAKIVVQNSPSKHSRYVPVDYTLRKYVRKPKGAAKGMAVYTNEKTLHVDG
jgi:predicted ribosome quality control (RQC) complex YloA/Tae2 family protein